MSTLLEQAIIDAHDLRAAALKNAESTILEKYNSEVKNAVETLLEQPLEDPFAEEEEDPLALGGLDDEMGAPEGGLAKEPPFSAAEGEEMCQCPDAGEEEVHTLNLADLQTLADELEGSPAMGAPEGRAGLMGDLGVEPEGEFSLQEDLELDEELFEMEGECPLEEDDEILDEAAIKDLVEELVVDISPEKSGWLGTSRGDMRHAEELELARLASTEAREEIEALKDARERLTITNESLVSKNSKLTEAILTLKGKLEEVILSNAKLLSVNQTLNSTSLNERQKRKIVESIQKVDSVEEAKVIYETLQNAVGMPERQPKSLRESISKPSTTMPRRRNVNSERESIAKERFQRLAGIK
jgi:FtsZ-binding cell division protein ZapB